MATTIDINGPLYPWTENDSRLIAEKVQEAGTDAELEVLVHSPGGSVWEGKKLFQLFMDHKGPVNGYVTLAASAASYLSMAFDKLFVYDYSEWMVHSALTWFDFFGNAKELEIELPKLQKEVINLRNEDKALAKIYSDRGNISIDDMTRYMDEETTWYGKDILEAGFATDILDTPRRGAEKENLAKFDLGCYKMHRKSAFHEKYAEGIEPMMAWDVQSGSEETAAGPDVSSDKIRHVAAKRAAARQRQIELRQRLR